MDIKRILNDLKTIIEQRHLSPQTDDSYASGLKTFCQYFPEVHHPTHVSKEQIIRFLAWVGVNCSLSKELQCFWALHFLYENIEGQPHKMDGVKKPKIVHKIPQVKSHQEVMEAFNKITNPHEKAIVGMFYSTGIRIGELCKIERHNIDPVRKTLLICQGKGGKDNLVPLNNYTINLLIRHWEALPTTHRQKTQRWLFVGENPNNYISKATVRRIVRRTLDVNPHLLRHCLGTYLHEKGVPLKAIADLFQHSSTRTTEIYTHTSMEYKRRLPNPMDEMKLLV
ncbi:MAG: tyrosine-type recombinase/integrase [Candidatus Omnitrophica bacterium]|nr:tyrosine-type recombinase/integrase [Candidatus Omnitrophota bacterium]